MFTYKCFEFSLTINNRCFSMERGWGEGLAWIKGFSIQDHPLLLVQKSRVSLTDVPFGDGWNFLWFSKYSCIWGTFFLHLACFLIYLLQLAFKDNLLPSTCLLVPQNWCLLKLVTYIFKPLPFDFPVHILPFQGLHCFPYFYSQCENLCSGVT